VSDATWQDMSDDELLTLHSKDQLPPEAERAIGKEHLRQVVAWDGANGERPKLFPEVAEEGPNYHSLTNKDLVNLLSARGLDVSGNKAKMIARLQADDETEDEEDDDEASEDEDEDDDDKGEPEKEEPKPAPEKVKAKKKKD
jgi:hypothetical protein